MTYRHWDDVTRTRFLAEIAEGNTVRAAAKATGVSLARAYQIRAEDADFADAWAAAYNEGTEAIEQEAYRRAVVGWEEPVYYKGERVGAVRRFDSTMLIFILKARAPEKYRETVNVEAYIRQRAEEEGIDPNAAIAAAKDTLRKAGAKW